MMMKLPRNVKALGITSLFNDIASEMIFPILPLFLTACLGASKSAVGLIEGIAESTSSILKLLSGYLSDRIGKRKIFAVTGYAIPAILRPLI
jgi:MFS family permease